MLYKVKPRGARRLPPPVALASNCVGCVQMRITLPYGEADGFYPLKIQDAEYPLQIIMFITYQSSKATFF